MSGTGAIGTFATGISPIGVTAPVIAPPVSASISLTEQQIFTALRSVMTVWLPPNTPIIRAQINRVPEPKAADFVIMSPLRRERLATNTDTYHDDPVVVAERTHMLLARMQITYQLDIHGPASAENAQNLAALLRSEVATQAFADTGLDLVPLFASDPSEVPFVNAEQQVEWRWIVEAALQANIVTTVAQEFADELTVTTISVETMSADIIDFTADFTEDFA